MQARAAEGSAPGNLLVRRSVALMIGGFPTGAVFRGRHGGEDVAFRDVLKTYFATEYLDAKLYRHYLRPGCHFYRFLERSKVVDGRIAFLRPAEHGEEVLAGILAHNRQFEARLRAIRFLKPKTAALASFSRRD